MVVVGVISDVGVMIGGVIDGVGVVVGWDGRYIW